MNKDFVPYKESLELEKLGLEFVEGSPCLGYHNMVNHNGKYEFDYRIWEVTDNYIESPTFSQAFRWLYQKLDIEKGVMPLDTESQKLLLKELIDEVSSKHLLV
jgi:hypothetical protein